MKTITNERVIPCDVDETLVMHDFSDYDNTVEVTDPHDVASIEVRPNEPMIKILKDEKARGAFIVVWSRGGYAWATAVIKALDLTEYVDLVMSKPTVYLDDKEVSTWLKDRVWISPDAKYKQTT